MLYAAKCYWPGVTKADFERLAARDHFRSRLIDVTYRGSLLFFADDLVLCLFESASRVAVKRACDALGIPCERVMDSVWLDPVDASNPVSP